MHASHVDPLTSVDESNVPTADDRQDITENLLMAAVNLTTLNFQTLGDAMKIEAGVSAARVTHYSIFDRTPTDIDDSDLAGDLDHLAASLDYLAYLASAEEKAPPIASPKPNGGGVTQACR